jgi:hypothetical protein
MRARDPSAKAIVFSQFVNMLDLIMWRLTAEGTKVREGERRRGREEGRGMCVCAMNQHFVLLLFFSARFFVIGGDEGE